MSRTYQTTSSRWTSPNNTRSIYSGPRKTISFPNRQRAIVITGNAIRKPYNSRSLPASFIPMGSEIKAIDVEPTTLPFTLPSTNTSVILLNGIQTGAGFFNRIGARIEMKSLHIRGWISPLAQGADQTIQPTLIRLLIVYDRQPTGSIPAISDVLQSRNQAGTPSTSIVSEINLDYRDRFKIIRDFEWYGGAFTTDGDGNAISVDFPGVDRKWELNEFINLDGLGTHFKSSSNPTTIADISTGALYMIPINSGDSIWNLNSGYRLRFNDK